MIEEAELVFLAGDLCRIRYTPAPTASRITKMITSHIVVLFVVPADESVVGGAAEGGTGTLEVLSAHVWSSVDATGVDGVGSAVGATFGEVSAGLFCSSIEKSFYCLRS